MNCYYGGQNYESLLIVMVNVNILYGITEKLRLTVKVWFTDKRYLSKSIKYTKDLLYDKADVDSFNTFEGERFLNSHFLTWIGLRHAVTLNLRIHPPSFTVILDPGYYSFLIKFKYEKPKKWAKIAEEFDLEDNCISETFSFPIRVCSEHYLRSFQYKVLNSILFTNEILIFLTVPSVKIPKKLETMYYLLVPFRTLFGWMLLPTF